jgi:S-adenosylmethionine:tRNA ribosyltransferase-isomerase
MFARMAPLFFYFAVQNFMLLSDFQYVLPDELIAHYPLPRRSASRLLYLQGDSGSVSHHQFTDLIDLLDEKDLLIVNNSKVIPARLWGMKATGGRIEMLVDRILDENRVIAFIRSSKTPRAGSYIFFGEVKFEVLGRHHELFELRCYDKRSVLEVIEALGQIPLPPYFQRAPEASDIERYQTIYAEHKGSVAAPTAGLHFDEEIFARLKTKGIRTANVTLHVGAGTFLPVRVDKITDHHMHAEFANVSQELCDLIHQTKTRGGRIIAVGTTAARSLETASRTGTTKPFCGETDIFIYPGFKFNCVDVLLTNFHLPATTLLMLVSAFAGHKNTMQAYANAVAEAYRFFSYGDAMLITRNNMEEAI